MVLLLFIMISLPPEYFNFIILRILVYNIYYMEPEKKYLMLWFTKKIVIRNSLDQFCTLYNNYRFHKWDIGPYESDNIVNYNKCDNTSSQELIWHVSQNCVAKKDTFLVKTVYIYLYLWACYEYLYLTYKNYLSENFFICIFKYRSFLRKCFDILFLI